jgi:hypothetical protein
MAQGKQVNYDATVPSNMRGTGPVLDVAGAKANLKDAVETQQSIGLALGAAGTLATKSIKAQKAQADDAAYQAASAYRKARTGTGFPANK